MIKERKGKNCSCLQLKKKLISPLYTETLKAFGTGPDFKLHWVSTSAHALTNLIQLQLGHKKLIQNALGKLQIQLYVFGGYSVHTSYTSNNDVTVCVDDHLYIIFIETSFRINRTAMAPRVIQFSQPELCSILKPVSEGSVKRIVMIKMAVSDQVQATLSPQTYNAASQRLQMSASHFTYPHHMLQHKNFLFKYIEIKIQV